MFPFALLHHLSIPVSNHCPLLLRCCPKFVIRTNRSKRFHFESAYAKELACGGIISITWAANQGSGIHTKLRAMGHKLQEWYKMEFSQVSDRIKALKISLDKLQNCVQSDDVILKTKQLRIDLNDAFEKEEAFWFIRSRVNWLQDGHKKTEFFHSHTTNKIVGLNDEADN